TGNCNAGVPPYNGTGLYKSTDGGQSFALLNANGISFVKVLVDPSAHNVVLAASYDKGVVYRSTDSGLHWTAIPGTGVSGFPWDMLATPSPGSVIYISTTSGIFKSADDGATWTKTTTGTNYITTIGRSQLASPTMAPNKVFVLVTDPGGSKVHLYESTDAGGNWDSLAVGNIISDLFNPNINAQGWYDLVLAVTPNSVTNDTLYVAGVMGYILYETGGVITVSTEYSDAGHGNGGNGYTHVDHHSFAFSPVNSNIVYDGDDGGLWVNYAAGSNDLSLQGGWQLHSHNMVTNRLYHLGLQPSNNNVTWAGAQDQGLWKMVNGQPPAKLSPLGDALQPLVSTQNPSHVFATGPDGEIEIQTNGVWGPPQDSSYRPLCKYWDDAFRMSPVSRGSTPGSQIIYIGGQYLFQSTTGGTSWTRFTPAFGSNDGVSACSAIGLPAWNANVIYAAGESGSFQLSTNFGANWTSRTYPGGIVTSINATSQDTNFVLVSLSNSKMKVMTSDDRGHTWTDASGVPGARIPDADSSTACSVMSIAVDSTNPLTTWYAGTDFGVYVTSDAGQHWSFAGPGLFPCRDIQLAANKATLRVATFGRGAWEITLPLSGVESLSLTASKSADGANLSWYTEGEPAGAMYYVQRSVDGDAFENIGSVAGLGVSSGRHDYSFADNTTASGTYLYQIHEIDANGSERYTNHVELHYGSDGIYFSQPYPNPFVLGAWAGASSPAISLNFELPARDNVLVRIYDIDGRLVRTLLDHSLDGGPHNLTWDARDNGGNGVAPGAYLCSIQTMHSGTVTNKIMIVRE
ncbi:MAG TPA: FlgD immunoglobulin-like domain containing protein, partial [Candidatus Kapabacteria bacterium]|nr:FlgD immunoglobulin-like domain containing protein [Candidatus Kapabacteria bacterium]